MNQATLATLAAFPQQLETHFFTFPPQFVGWKPASWDGIPSEPFSAIEQICHVRDIEIDGYHVRLRRTRDESHPMLATIDGVTLAVERSYATANPAAVFNAFRAARKKTLDFVASLTPQELAHTAEFEGQGVVTMRALVHYLCSHDQQHLAGLQWLLARIAVDERAGR